jgi:hypothetical protein
MQSGFGKTGRRGPANIDPWLGGGAFALCNSAGTVRQIMFSQEVPKA